MGRKQYLTVSDVFVLVMLLSLDCGIGTHANHMASETVKNQCSIACPRAHACQLISRTGKFFLRCARLGGQYKLHPYVETRSTSRHAEKKKDRLHNIVKQVKTGNPNLIGNNQQQGSSFKSNTFAEISQPKGVQNQLSMLINLQSELKSQLGPAMGLLPRQALTDARVKGQKNTGQRVPPNPGPVDNPQIKANSIPLSEFNPAVPVVENMRYVPGEREPVFKGLKIGPAVPSDVIIVKNIPDTLAHEYIPENIPAPQTNDIGDLSGLLNFSPFGDNLGNSANMARTNGASLQTGQSARRRVNTVDSVASRILAGRRDSLQFAPSINELPSGNPD
ncbi:uncharacterized protein LOC128220566 isoform X2 [Mya arenaria]|nr:uncharacterized protein LOC128220566 isoform X2 [Mya arenaria]